MGALHCLLSLSWGLPFIPLRVESVDTADPAIVIVVICFLIVLLLLLFWSNWVYPFMAVLSSLVSLKHKYIHNMYSLKYSNVCFRIIGWYLSRSNLYLCFCDCNNQLGDCCGFHHLHWYSRLYDWNEMMDGNACDSWTVKTSLILSLCLWFLNYFLSYRS